MNPDPTTIDDYVPTDRHIEQAAGDLVDDMQNEDFISETLTDQASDRLERMIVLRIRQAITHRDRFPAAAVPSSSAQEPGEQLDGETAKRLREYLWLGHGHQGQYGDDGEMQCGRCAPVWDYRRAPLADVIRQAMTARREVNLAALLEQSQPAVSSPSVADNLRIEESNHPRGVGLPRCWFIYRGRDEVAQVWREEDAEIVKSLLRTAAPSASAGTNDRQAP